MSRQETNCHGNCENWNEIYVIDVLHMYMTPISIKLTSDNGNMVLFNGYKLGETKYCSVYVSESQRKI